jgi:heptosyltransferase II
MNKMLVVGPAWVGDMVMAQTVFRYLKQQYPDAVIDVIAPPSSFQLLAFMPEVRRGIKLSLGHGQFQFFARVKLGWSLRKEKYTQAVVLTNSWKSALPVLFAGIKKRIGWRGEMRYGLLNDMRVLDKAKYPLMIQRFLALCVEKNTKHPEWFLNFPESLKQKPLLPEQKTLLPHFSVADQQAVLAKLQLSTDKKIVALCPGAAFGPSKRWPPEYFAEVAKQKIQDGYAVWVFGAPSDNKAAEKIEALTQQQVVNLAGKTSLPEAIALLSLSSVVLTNDSGLMHIACALQKPVVAIYGSSSPAFTPPLSECVSIQYLQIECSPCFQRECPLKHWRCMRELTADKVLSAVQSIEGGS